MGTYYANLGGTRILSSDRTDQSGADDANVTNWTKTNDFILAVNINSGGKDSEAAQYKLRWRDVTDVGSFADVGSTGEIKFGSTDLVDGATIAVGGRKCDSQGGDTWQTGYEVEGTALSTSIDLADEYETEIHFSLSVADGDDSHQYEFELYDSTAGASRGTCGSALTTAAGLTHYTLEVLAGSITITGSSVDLLKGYELVPSPGSYTITGADVTLSRTREIVAGSGSFLISGQNVDLLKDSKIVPSPGNIAITGQDVTLSKGRIMTVDPGVVTITGLNTGLLKGSKTITEPGSFLVTGSGVSLEKGYKLSLLPGGFIFTGSSVDFEIDTGAGQVGPSLAKKRIIKLRRRNFRPVNIWLN